MRVCVLGAGIIGLACADELQRRGHEVTVVDPQPGSGASYAAAGMLSPGGEAWYGESRLLDLGLRSLALWPSFASRLGVPLVDSGTVLAGVDAGDLALVDRQVELLRAHGVPVERLTAREVLARRPLLGQVGGGAFLPAEASVDPRHVVAALLERVTLAEHPGDVDVTVVATGVRLPEPFAHLVRPVRGEIVRARAADLPPGMVRGWVRGVPVYVVARPTGEVVIGATAEEHDSPPVVSLGGLSQLLDAARELVPSLEWATFVEATARDRPATPDNLPLIGPVTGEPIVLATGHHRGGVLLAPLTAQLVADQLEGGYVDPLLDPRRFSLERTTA